MQPDHIFQPGVKHLIRHANTVAALGALAAGAFVVLAYRNVVWIRGGPQILKEEETKK
jgi:hypothetical protein